MSMTVELKRGLYFAADTSALPLDEICEVTQAALEGGVVLVQLRSKNLGREEMVRSAARLTELCDEYGVPLLINDFPEVAAEAGAHGVHVGQEDVSVAEARKVLGPGAIIGATTLAPEAVRRAEAEGADYVSAGPMFRSPTKPDKPVAGPDLARRLRELTELPLCVIGGITAQNVGQLAECGVDLVCVISAIAAAEDPRAATERIIAAMRSAAVAM
jgi:thiamine-phosphate diphosphorylase